MNASRPPAGAGFTAVLRAAEGWVGYRDPVELVAAHRLDEVRPALDRLVAATATGLTAVGLLSYEAAPAFEPVAECHPPGEFPLLWFGLFERGEPLEPPAAGPAYHLGPWQPKDSAAAYTAAIARIHAAIAAGETYQVNHTTRLRATATGDPWGLALDLWQAQPTAYAAWLDLGRWAVASASPELFFELDGEQVTARPMKGTARRGPTPATDAAQAAALGASAKDRAENLMIVDMLRNDLGRVARVGSVAVPRLFELERYDQLWQLTSTITARTDAPLPALCGALFPCASITGAPKLRTMSLIRSLEPLPRGVYCGAIGRLGPGRQARFNVAIRTVVWDRAAGQAEFGVGGGIVWDSTAAGEWQECETKALLLTHRPPRFELLETMLWRPGQGWFLAPRHLARLRRSAAYFGLACDEAALAAALAPGAWTGPQRVRLRLAPDGALHREATPFEPGPPRVWQVAPAAAPVDSADRWLYHKTTHRAVYEAARAARPGVDDVVLYNERGELTETTIANLALRLDGRLWTPPVSSGLLAGTYRDLALARGWVRERVLHLDDLHRASELWLLNSVRGWVRAAVSPAAPAPTRPAVAAS